MSKEARELSLSSNLEELKQAILVEALGSLTRVRLHALDDVAAIVRLEPATWNQC